LYFVRSLHPKQAFYLLFSPYYTPPDDRDRDGLKYADVVDSPIIFCWMCAPWKAVSLTKKT